MKQIQEFFANLKSFTTISWIDIIDILLVAVLIYYVINLIRTTSANRIAKAIIFLLAVTLITDLLCTPSTICWTACCSWALLRS